MRHNYLEEKEKSSEKGSIHKFQWERIAPVAGESISIEIDFFHDRIRAFQKQYEIPEKNEQKNQDIFDMISFVLVYLVFIVLGVIFH